MSNLMKKVAFATGSRADYGIVRQYLKLLKEDNRIDLKILATGALLDKKYGHQIDLIIQDGFHVDIEIEIGINTSAENAIIESMACALEKFGTYFSDFKYDILIILGDRYEMLSVAIAAAMQKIPILHIHGGEATYANYDEFIRHCITKMSRYHFTSTSEYQKRVIQLGENPTSVFDLGALGAENCLSIDETNVCAEVKKFHSKKYFVILFHPETLTNVNVLTQIKTILNVIIDFPEYQFVFIGTNADTYSDVIRNEVQRFVEIHVNAYYFENLHTDGYHYLLKNSICLVGNSSSGIIEAPSLGIQTINIGDRQRGRVRGNSVLDVKCEEKSIHDAMELVMKAPRKLNIENPYFKENCSTHYYQKTLDILGELEENKGSIKEFYDINIDGK